MKRKVFPSREYRAHNVSLRVARQIKELSQEELADRAGVDHTLISRIESGERPIESVGYQSVARLALVLQGPEFANPLHLFPIALPAATPEGEPV